MCVTSINENYYQKNCHRSSEIEVRPTSLGPLSLLTLPLTLDLDCQSPTSYGRDTKIEGISSDVMEWKQTNEPRASNSLPDAIRRSPSLAVFKRSPKTHFLSSVFISTVFITFSQRAVNIVKCP